jgi:hypothetical protein
MVDPIRVHLITIKHVMRYLKDTMDYGFKYVADNEINLLGYSDSDWVGSVANQKSTLGCCFTLGFSMISWISKKKSCVALNTIEAVYVEACATSCEAVWFQKLLTGLSDIAIEATCILCNNQKLYKVIREPSVS